MWAAYEENSALNRHHPNFICIRTSWIHLLRIPLDEKRGRRK